MRVTTLLHKGPFSTHFVLTYKQVEPSNVRVGFDLDVTLALGVKVSEDELREVYAAIVNEMIATRGLTKD